MPPRVRSILVRAFRLAVLVMAAWLMRGQQRAQVAGERNEITVERIRDFFPTAALLEDGNELRAVKDASGVVIGSITQTAPGSDSIIGYSGPTNTLLAFDARGALIGLRILSSGDTPDHLAEVIRDRDFFAQFRELKMGGHLPKVHAVSGATLTSSAIAEGVLQRLGQETTSLRFPEAITLDEVQALEPRATAIHAAKKSPRMIEVLGEDGKTIALATRTSPTSDAITGYKGPTDTLMLLDAEGRTLRAIRIRKSYETKSYLGYVTGDDYFMRLFNGKSIDQLASLDFDKEGVEGVSGATITSWSVAEGLRQRSARMVAEREAAAGWWKQIRWRWQDTGHLLVILSAFVMAFTPLRGHALVRNLHHALLVVYAGFIIAELLSQALMTGWARHGIPWRSAPGLVLLGVIALAAPIFSRRQLYCHHICPHGALQQLLMRRLKWQWQPAPRLERVLEMLPYALLLFVLFAGVLGWQVDLNTIEPFDAYLVRIAGWSALLIAVLGLIFALFTPMAYCRYGCPTGALFKWLRFTGDADKLGSRDWLALAALGVALLAGHG